MGFSLVELLVVTGIIGVLASLVLPAIQSSRETARRLQCGNNLKQISLALIAHHNTHKHFPYGGWGHAWVGVPELGSGRQQPGGWIFSILPFMEEQALYDLGSGLGGNAAHDAYTKRLETPLPLFTCPSRRKAVSWPIVFPYVASPRPYGLPQSVARSDYAINAGASHILSYEGPASLAQGRDCQYWQDTTYIENFTGISHLRNAVSMHEIEDGSSNTYLAGEKYLNSADYETGRSLGDNESMYSGYCTDLHRFTGNLNADNNNLFLPPFQDISFPDKTALPGFVRFGSAHSTGFNMAYCDGSVRWVLYNIDGEIHLRNGHRHDGAGHLSSLTLHY